MKYINPYNDLILGKLVVEAFKFDMKYIKDFIKKKKEFIPIDFDEIEKEALAKGKKITAAPTKPVKKLK